MRIIRFLGSDSRVHHGEQLENGSASVLLDPQGIFGPAGATSQRGLFAGRRVLVADDDDKMREMMAAVLQRVGCECTVCHDGAQAMQAIGREPLDMIVTDIVMPHHNGYELFAAARETRADLPIVLVTGFGYDPNHSLVRATQEGAVAVLYKPFAPQRLLDELEEAVRLMTERPADALRRSDHEVGIEQVLAPIEPTNIVCVGRNYPEAGGTPPDRGASDDEMEVFIKPSTSVQNPFAPIQIPDCGDEDPLVEAEGELAVIIGATTRDVAPEDAMNGVLGFTAANDVTARRWQTTQGAPIWMRGKGFDTFCPLGPEIVTRDAVADANDLEVRTLVNGEVVRSGSTSSMLRSVESVVSTLSRGMTLRPGTVILTGAPPPLPGVAPRRLQAGDEVAVEIDGIGRLVNPVETCS
ncbi:MAG: fumarylacetoacetate hydrolase family protein [Planctomycetota bacterium]|jgi:2-keto-4-pentenoate hydratase/2-oxohepta-3-ene-1,7-dioic acid hydratase in catechol pathway